MNAAYTLYCLCAAGAKRLNSLEREKCNIHKCGVVNVHLGTFNHGLNETGSSCKRSKWPRDVRESERKRRGGQKKMHWKFIWGQLQSLKCKTGIKLCTSAEYITDDAAASEIRHGEGIYMLVSRRIVNYKHSGRKCALAAPGKGRKIKAEVIIHFAFYPVRGFFWLLSKSVKRAINISVCVYMYYLQVCMETERI